MSSPNKPAAGTPNMSDRLMNLKVKLQDLSILPNSQDSPTDSSTEQFMQRASASNPSTPNSTTAQPPSVTRKRKFSTSSSSSSSSSALVPSSKKPRTHHDQLRLRETHLATNAFTPPSVEEWYLCAPDISSFSSADGSLVVRHATSAAVMPQSSSLPSEIQQQDEGGGRRSYNGFNRALEGRPRLEEGKNSASEGPGASEEEEMEGNNASTPRGKASRLRDSDEGQVNLTKLSSISAGGGMKSGGKEKRGRQSSGGAEVRCHICGELGHIKKNCPRSRDRRRTK